MDDSQNPNENLREHEAFDRVHAALRSEEPIAEPTGGYEAFTERLVDRLASHERDGVLATSPRRFAHWGWRAAAAVGLVMLGWLGATLVPRGGTQTPTGVPALATADLLPPNTSEQVGVFTQVSKDFDRRAAWVAFSDGQSDIGIASDALPTSRLVLLRLTLSHAGRSVSQADLVIVPGRTAKLDLPFRDGQRLHYTVEVSTDERPRFALVAELRGTNGRGTPLAALSSQLQLESSNVASAGQMVTQNGGYELSLGFEQINW